VNFVVIAAILILMKYRVYARNILLNILQILDAVHQDLQLLSMLNRSNAICLDVSQIPNFFLLGEVVAGVFEEDGLGSTKPNADWSKTLDLIA